MFRFTYKLGFWLLIILMMSCREEENLVQGLDQNDANEILLALREANILAQKKAHNERKGQAHYDIIVETHNLAPALRLLSEKRLPKAHRAGLKEIYETNKSGLIPSKSDEEARLSLALQGEIESLIKLMPRVLDVRVVLSLEQENLANKKSERGASVAVLAKPGSSDLKLEIQELVSAALGNIKSGHIYVAVTELTEAFKQEPSLLVKEPEPAENPLYLWVFLAITILSILVAAYALIRLNTVNHEKRAYHA